MYSFTFIRKKRGSPNWSAIFSAPSSNPCEITRNRIRLSPLIRVPRPSKMRSSMCLPSRTKLSVAAGRRNLRNHPISDSFERFGNDSFCGTLLRLRGIVMAERFLTNYTTAAGQFSPVDPFVFHPVINRRSANRGKTNGFLDRQKLRVFAAVVAEEERHWGYHPSCRN
jgi:hypothetical protein